MKAVLHRVITVNTTTGKMGYEKIELSPHAVSLHVSGEIVTVMAGGQAVAAAKLSEKDYITFEPESE